MKKLITMLSALTITSSIMPLTVACDKEENKTSDELKGETIDLSKITADMIINWKDKYEVEEGKDSILASKLGTLDNSVIQDILKNNLHGIIAAKISGINKSKLVTKFLELLVSGDITASNSEILSYTTIDMFKDYIEIVVTPSNESKENIKTFNIEITLKKWSEIETEIKEVFDREEAHSEEIPSLEELINILKKENKEQQQNVDDITIEKIAKNQIQYMQAFKKLDINSVKSMYELIKGENKTTIKVELPEK